MNTDSGPNASAPRLSNYECNQNRRVPRLSGSGQRGGQRISLPEEQALERLSIAKITIPPHTSVEKHYHLQSEEVYQIIDGEGAMLLGKETRKVGPGEAVPIPPGTWHSIDKQSDQDLVMIVTCSPPWTPEDQVFES